MYIFKVFESVAFEEINNICKSKNYSYIFFLRE